MTTERISKVIMTTDSHVDAIVIGAGVSGLIAARTAQANGARVLVLDKGRGVGGRLATRRTDSGVFDHGAQFFTARDPQFRLLVEAWRAAGIPTAPSSVMAKPGSAASPE